MVNIRRLLIKDITEAISAARAAGALPDFEMKATVVVKRTEDASHGHYSSPIALSLAKAVQKNPLEVAEIIASHMPVREYIEGHAVAAPGFINMTLSSKYLAARIDDLPQDDYCSACNVGNNKTINMEFISANPTGPLTLGNARTAFSADTLANVFECAGYNVVREYYINDAGEQVGRLGQSVLRRILQQQGAQVDFPEDLYQGEYVLDIATRIAEEYEETHGKKFEVADLENAELCAEVSTKAMLLCLTAIKKTVEEDLHISFDVWTSEREVRNSGAIERVLEQLREKGLMYKKEDAEFLKTTQFGDDKDRVMVKSGGAYAYITPDVAYHQEKFDRGFDIIFTYLGADHQGHIPKLKAALQALGNDTSKLRMVVAQFLAIVRSGEQVALSKRKGNVYSPNDLINEIGYDAARFFMVQHALDGHMVLDIDIAKEKSDRNPVYYVQYAYVRLQSILRKAQEQGILPLEYMNGEIASQVIFSEEAEKNLALELFRFPEVIEDIATSYNVHQLAYFSYDIARAVNAFYRDVKVLSEDDPTLRMSRLQMAISARAVLGKVLDLLGIGKPDVM